MRKANTARQGNLSRYEQYLADCERQEKIQADFDLPPDMWEHQADIDGSADLEFTWTVNAFGGYMAAPIGGKLGVWIYWPATPTIIWQVAILAEHGLPIHSDSGKAPSITTAKLESESSYRRLNQLLKICAICKSKCWEPQLYGRV